MADWKDFIVNIEGPDDIEDFNTMREAAERANQINAELVDTVSRGGEFAPHMWAVPWRTATYLAQGRSFLARECADQVAHDAAIVEALKETDQRLWNAALSVAAADIRAQLTPVADPCGSDAWHTAQVPVDDSNIPL